MEFMLSDGIDRAMKPCKRIFFGVQCREENSAGLCGVEKKEQGKTLQNIEEKRKSKMVAVVVW